MRLSLRGRVVNLFYGTRFEYSARKLYEYLFQRDNYEVNRQTVEVMRRVLRPDSICVDVGCYRGDILRHMLRLCPQGEAFAFEPAPQHHDFLRREFPKAQLFPVALGATVGTATFCIDRERPARSGLATAEMLRPAEAIEELTVRVDTLDSTIPRRLLIDFLKINAEGAEFDVIRGGEDTIRRSQPLILFEHGGRGGATVMSERLFALLCDQLGLRLFTIDDWLRGKPPMDRSDFCDCARSGRDWNFIAAPPTSQCSGEPIC